MKGASLGVVFLVRQRLVRLAVHELHFVPVLHLPHALQHEAFVRGEPLAHEENVVLFLSNRDLPLFHDAVRPDDEHESLVQHLERRPLGDDDGALERSVDEHAAGLAVPQQALRVGKVRTEGNVPGLVVELGLDRADDSRMGKGATVREDQFDLPRFFLPTAGMYSR